MPRDEQTVGGHIIPKNGNIDLGQSKDIEKIINALEIIGPIVTSTGAISSSGSITLGAGADLIGSSTSDITINTNKFTVAGASGNTVVAGTHAAGGSITLGAGADLIGSSTSDITVNTNKFTVAGATGNTVIAGTCGITGATTITGELITVANCGTVNTGVTAVEYGNGRQHTTVLTVSQADALTTGDNANLADGYLLYTLPAGACIINSAYMSMGITATTEQAADTPDVGLGTVIGTGAVATLDGTATFENILTGQTAADAAGTATVKTTGAQILAIETGDAHTVHFNVADGWADDTSADLTCDIAGTVVINWTFVA